jgi:hypothetical protein
MEGCLLLRSASHIAHATGYIGTCRRLWAGVWQGYTVPQLALWSPLFLIICQECDTVSRRWTWAGVAKNKVMRLAQLAAVVPGVIMEVWYYALSSVRDRWVAGPLVMLAAYFSDTDRNLVWFMCIVLAYVIFN